MSHSTLCIIHDVTRNYWSKCKDIVGILHRISSMAIYTYIVNMKREPSLKETCEPANIVCLKAVNDLKSVFAGKENGFCGFTQMSDVG